MSSQDVKLIDGSAKTVQELFTGRTYSIEYYQREYSWGRSNIEELIQDLYRSFTWDFEDSHSRIDVASYRPYFLGPVVTFSKDGVRFLVDGQQRMTSLSLLMIHISTLLEPGDSQDQLRTLVYSTKYGQTQFTIDVPDREAVMSAIRLGKSIEVSNLDQSSKVLWDRYQDISEIFPSELEGKVLPYFVDWLLDKVVLVEIGTTDKNMALEIFESMNDRGLRLSNMDMLKSFILSKIGNSEEVEQANKLWRSKVQDLGELLKNGDTEFMKTFLRAKYAETVRDTKKSGAAQDFEEIATVFHKWFRDKTADIGLITGPDFTRFVGQDMSYFADRYKLLVEASQSLSSGLEYVFYNAYNAFTLQNMVILASTSTDDDINAFKRKANLIAAFLDMMITRRMGEYKNFGYSPMYRPMFALAKEVRNLSVEDLKYVLQERLRELPESIDSLQNLRLTKTNKPDLYYILARITSWLESENSDRYFNRRVADPYEVEHIWANKFERHLNEFQNQFEFEEHRNKLGDLLLLPKSFNASYGAMSFEKKVEHYYGQNVLAKSLNARAYANNPNFLAKVKQFNLSFRAYGGDEFDKDAITQRQALYVEVARIVWSPSVLAEM